jgi:hypothetical protein
LIADDAVRARMPVAGQLLFRAVEEIIDLLEVLSDERPLLLELDDLHWADGSTLTAVLWAVRRLTEIPLLLVGTLRPTPRDRDLGHLVEEAMRSGATLVRLAPLDEDDVMALVQAELGLAPGPALAEAVRGAGGNPLWVVELLRSLSAEKLLDLTGDQAVLSSSELPDSIRQLVLGRLGELPEKTVSALRIASLLGEEFALRDLATVTGRRVTDLVEELGEAFRAGLIADHRGKLVFRHQLVRDAVYEDIPEAARIALHREAAGVLAEGGAPLAQGRESPAAPSDRFYRALIDIDSAVAGSLTLLRPDHLLILTADHGADPTASHTDHAREYAPLLATFLGCDGPRHGRLLADVGARVRAGSLDARPRRCRAARSCNRKLSSSGRRVAMGRCSPREGPDERRLLHQSEWGSATRRVVKEGSR